MKTRITLTAKELSRLRHIMWHFTDYMAGDDRPDHGFGILEQYRYMSNVEKSELYFLAGRLNRLDRKLRERMQK